MWAVDVLLIDENEFIFLRFPLDILHHSFNLAFWVLSLSLVALLFQKFVCMSMLAYVII